MMWIEEARLLLLKAAQDAAAVRVFGTDPDISDEIVGFHTQQACEKALKAVLSAKGVEFPFTHNLVQLRELLLDSGVQMPADVAEVVEWTPFAAFFRYAEWTADEALDRPRAMTATNSTIAWAEATVAELSAPDNATE